MNSDDFISSGKQIIKLSQMVSYSPIGLDAIRLQKVNGQWTIVVLRGRNLRPEKMILSTQNTKTEAFNNNDCTLVLLAIVYIMNFTFSKEDIDVPNPENCNMQVMTNLIPSFIQKMQTCTSVWLLQHIFSSSWCKNNKNWKIQLLIE